MIRSFSTLSFNGRVAKLFNGRLVLRLHLTAVSSYWRTGEVVLSRIHKKRDTVRNKKNRSSWSPVRGSTGWRHSPCPKEVLQHRYLQIFRGLNRWRTQFRTFVQNRVAYSILVRENLVLYIWWWRGWFFSVGLPLYLMNEHKDFVWRHQPASMKCLELFWSDRLSSYPASSFRNRLG